MANVKAKSRTTRVICRASKHSPRITMDLRTGAYKVEPRNDAKETTEAVRPNLRLVKASSIQTSERGKTGRKARIKDTERNIESIDQKISRLLKEARADLDL